MAQLVCEQTGEISLESGTCIMVELYFCRDGVQTSRETASKMVLSLVDSTRSRTLDQVVREYMGERFWNSTSLRPS